ncbi:F-box only protein 6-like isoform X2 [Pseudophryne corroboree]|uniref:F-box only protein 6-like isoform X2 n=1 Tax=Pseudophryne corroboree TaxID=495146 RepID=UPI0030813491
MAAISDVPEGVLLEILSSVPHRDLILQCRLVCSVWRDVIDSHTLWKMKCQRDGFLPKDWRKNPPDWRMFYVLSYKKRNLLRNPCATDDFNFWHKNEDLGDGWKVETLPGDHGQSFPEESVRKYFVTSYGPCIKSQTIDLTEEGYYGDLMDVMQPAIVIKDWYAARHDCGCRYTLLVQLLSKEHTVIEEFCPEPVVIPQWSDAKWAQVEHTFSSYGPGVRYVHFQHGGQDTQFWAGWFGIRVTNSSVMVDPGNLTA